MLKSPLAPLLLAIVLAFPVCQAGAAWQAGAPSLGQSGAAALEGSIKAAFMFKFLGYTEFPAGAFSDSASPVLIGVLGSDEMATELSRIAAGRSINNRPVVVRPLRDNEPAGPLQLLFVAGADNARTARVLKQAQPGPMLLVTECENCLQLGSVINFKIVDERVRFDISLEAADKNNLKLSSRLLTVANHVSKGAP